MQGLADIPRKVWASLQDMPKGRTFRCSPFYTEEPLPGLKLPYRVAGEGE